MKRKEHPSLRRYLCLDRREGQKLLDYYNQTLTEQEACGFEEHLLFCFRCQEILVTLDLIFRTLKERQEEYFNAERKASASDLGVE